MGGEFRTAHSKLYINVMEVLVAEEVGRQLENLPERVTKYVRRTEVETFALNRLPALYASSERGLQHQYERAQHEYGAQITSAVKQAFAAVQVDPIRLSQPLQLNQEEEAVLQALRDLLRQPELDWKAALKEIRRLQQRRRSAASPGQQPAGAGSGGAEPEQPRTQAPQEEHSTVWRPGTYGSRVGWKPKHSQSTSESGFGDNAR